ncbi:MAG: Dabb family protein [Bacteroidota bacterium]
MTNHRIIMVRGVLWLALIGCTLAYSTTATAQHTQKVLRHVVTFQFKDEVTTERREQAVQDFLALADEIPEIKSFEGGANISVEGLNSGYTHCFILTFENEAARDIYLPHPAHKKLAERNKPLMKALVVMDVWGEE